MGAKHGGGGQEATVVTSRTAVFSQPKAKARVKARACRSQSNLGWEREAQEASGRPASSQVPWKGPWRQQPQAPDRSMG